MVDISASSPQPGGGQTKHKISAGGVLKHALALSVGWVFAGQVAAAGCPAGTTAIGDNLIPDGDFKVTAPSWDTDYPFLGVVTDGLSPFPQDNGAVIVDGSWENAAGAQAPLTPGGSWWYTNGNTTADPMTVWAQAITGLDADKIYAFTVNYTNVIDPAKDKGSFTLELPILQIQVDGANQLDAPIPVVEGDDADEWFSVDVEISGKEAATLTILDLFLGPNSLGDDLGIAGLNLQECKSDEPDPTDPAISVTDDIDFGTVTVGEIAEEAITVTNTGDIALEISEITAAGTGFTLDAANCLDNTPLATGDTCSINVTFAPTETGEATGAVSIASNDPENATTAVGLAGTATAAPNAVLEVTPASIDFPNTIAGQSSDPVEITVSNIGTAELVLDDPLATSALQAFTLDTTDCDGKTLAVTGAAGDSCLVQATFNPIAAGDSAEIATLTAAGLTSEVALTGTASNAPESEIDLSSVGQDGITIPAKVGNSESQVITVGNSGTGPLVITEVLAPANAQFDIDASDCLNTPVTIGETCDITVTFTPTAEATVTDQITLESNAPSSPTVVPVIGVGISGERDSDGDGISDLDEIKIGTDPEERDTDGDGIDDNIEIGANPARPSDTDEDTIIDALESNIIDTDDDGRFNFDDADDDNDGILTQEECAEKRSATCADIDDGKTGIANNNTPDYLEPKPTVTLTGEVDLSSIGEDGITLPAQVGNTETRVVRVSNSGAGLLNITQITPPSAAQFDIDTSQCLGATLVSGDSCSISVNFTPTEAGTVTDRITIQSDDPSSPTSFPVIGEGSQGVVLNPALNISPIGIQFPNTVVGETSDPREITVSNTGDAALVLDDPLSISAVQAFSLDTSNCDGKTLAIAGETGDSCTVTATFNPTSAGNHAEIATVTASGFMADVGLIGFSTNQPESAIDLSSVGQDGITIPAAVGKSESKVISVGNSGTAPLVITAVTAAADPQFSIDGSACLAAPVAIGANCDITVTFTPTAEATVTDEINIQSNAATSPTTVPVVGIGISGERDSDQDGITDLDELKIGTDPEQRDTDGDGLDDGVEIGADPAQPTDTDEDGIIDALESNIIDTDDDGRFNFNDADDDADGILTQEECAGKQTPTCADVDSGETGIAGNKVADYLEPKAAAQPVGQVDLAAITTEGLSIAIKVGESATQVATVSNTGAGPLVITQVIPPSATQFDMDADACLDAPVAAGESCDIAVTFTPTLAGTVTNRITLLSNDPASPASFTVIGEGIRQAVLEESDEKTQKADVLTDIEGGLGSAGLPLFSLLGAAAWFRRRRVAAAVTTAIGGAVIGVTPVQAQQGKFYIGAGLGQSILEPDPNNSGYTLEDDSDTGGKLFLGFDLTDYLSLEGYYADLGSASLSLAGVEDTIDYAIYGADLVLHYPGSLPGITGFLKLGVGRLQTDSDNIQIHNVNNTQTTGGLGLEYQFSNRISLRGEYDFFDEDAQLISLNLLKRFGGERETVPEPIPPVEPSPPVDSDGDGVLDPQDKCPETAPGVQVDASGCPVDTDGDGVLDSRDNCPETPKGVQVDGNGCPVVLDSDRDGVADSSDQCPQTAAGVQVDINGCALVDYFTGVLEGVNFHTDSDRLTGEAMSILDGVAQELQTYPGIQVVIVGHTDNQGQQDFNQSLSLRRAKSVARYLLARGVEAERMRYAGKGEDQPITTNATAEGRARNRRVEFIANDI